jgi:enoyl-CoA hydratase/carnithine racemase
VADLEYTVTDGIATILLNRPAVKNAFTDAMIDEWAAALRLGIASHVYDDADFAASWHELACRIAAQPPLNVQLIKRVSGADAGQVTR